VGRELVWMAADIWLDTVKAADSSFFNRFKVKSVRPILEPEFGRRAGFGRACMDSIVFFFFTGLCQSNMVREL